MHTKDFNNWNNKKQKINSKNRKIYFKERDIFFINLGKNVGDEQDGKGESFLRPVIVLRKFNNKVFLAIPLTSNLNKNSEFYFSFTIAKNNRKNNAILSQIKLIDSKRIINKIGMISEGDFINLKRKINKLLKLTDFS